MIVFYTYLTARFKLNTPTRRLFAFHFLRRAADFFLSLAAERMWNPRFLLSVRSVIRSVCAPLPSLSAGFNLNEFRRITKVDVCNAVYCHSWAARRAARSNVRNVLSRASGLSAISLRMAICRVFFLSLSRRCLKDKCRTMKVEQGEERGKRRTGQEGCEKEDGIARILIESSAGTIY